MQKISQTQIKKYRVPYQECKLHSQKLNYICLDPKCHQNSLICSICRQEPSHKQHIIRPLKFYMQELHQKYSKSSAEQGLHSMLEDIQVKQFQFYQKLKKAVEDIAQQFRKLEEEVNQKFNEIKSEIYDEIAKRNKFKEFHQSLKAGDVDLSNFLIQNYLPQASVGSISNLDNIPKLSQQICEEIKELKSTIFSRQLTDCSKFGKKDKKTVAFNILDMQNAIKRPVNILFDNNVLTQTSIQGGKQNLCLIDFPVVNLSGKLVFKILQMKKNSHFTFGVVPKKVYESMNGVWVLGKFDNRSYVLGSDGFFKGWQKRQIYMFGQGSTLELSYRSGQLKINQKNKVCTVKMPNDQDLFVYCSLIGDTQVRITHLK